MDIEEIGSYIIGFLGLIFIIYVAFFMGRIIKENEYLKASITECMAFKR